MKDELKTRINLPTGYLSLDQLEALFATLPLDITYVDKDDQIIYFSNKEELIFERPIEILETPIQEYHAKSSLPAIEKMIDDFKNNRSNEVEMWTIHKRKIINIKYLAVRNKEGEYLGIMETAQDVTKIRKKEVEEEK